MHHSRLVMSLVLGGLATGAIGLHTARGEARRSLIAPLHDEQSGRSAIERAIPTNGLGRDLVSMLAPAEDVGWQKAQGGGIPSYGWQRGGTSGVAARAPLDASGERVVGLGRVRRFAVGITLEGAQNTPAELDRGRLLYRDALPSTDVILVTDESRFEELWVLHDEQAPTAFTWNLQVGKGIEDVVERGGGLAFMDHIGRGVMWLPPPVAVDARGVSRSVSIKNEGTRITFSIDNEGLSYPIVVDPGLVEFANWYSVSPTIAPGSRAWHAMEYHPTFGVVIRHGGIPDPFPQPNSVDETLYLSGGDWVPLQAGSTRPTARAGESLTANATGNLVLLGGHDASGAVSNQHWELVGTISSPAWADLTASQGLVSARSGQAAARSSDDKVVFYGGGQRTPATTSANADAYRLESGTGWVSEDTTGEPMVRDGALLRAPAVDMLYHFGGRNCTDPSCVAVSPFARISGAWSAAPPISGTAPSTRWGMASTFDTVRNRAVIFGGTNGTTVFGDTWEFTGTRWYPRVTVDPQTPLAFSAMAFDPGLNGIIRFGGQIIPNLANDMPSTSLSNATFKLLVTSAACSNDGQCDTGHCVDGACCEVASCGSCETCNSATDPGYCSPVVNSPDPDTCPSSFCLGGCCPSGCAGSCADCTNGGCGVLATGAHPWMDCFGFRCDGVTSGCATDCSEAGCEPGYVCVPGPMGSTAKVCVIPAQAGGACTDDLGCASGECVDLVCCDTACTGVCQTCNVQLGAIADGVCSPRNAGQGNCPVNEVCDGTSSDCVPNGTGGTAGSSGAGGTAGTGGASGTGGTSGAGGTAGSAGAAGSAGGVVCPKDQVLYSDGRCYDVENPIDPHKIGGCSCDLAKTRGQDENRAGWLLAASAMVIMARRKRRKGASFRDRTRGAAKALRLLAWLGFPIVVSTGGCTHDMDKDEPCKNANYAIASRTHACTGDSALANQRYENVETKYQCVIDKPLLTQFLCASGIDNLTCDQVKRYGDDYDRWYAASSECALIFRHADGSPLPTPTSTGPVSADLDASADCTAAIAAMGARWGQCLNAPFSMETKIREGLAGKYGCAGNPGSASSSNTCVNQLPSMACVQDNAAIRDVETFLSGVPACGLLFPRLTP